jgi:hypothetical protein
VSSVTPAADVLAAELSALGVTLPRAECVRIARAMLDARTRMRFSSPKAQSRLANVTAIIIERQGRVSCATVAAQLGIGPETARLYLAEARRLNPKLP